jgi:hypothetical protein
MRYSNGGYIGSGVYPNEYGDIDGVWRYFTDVARAIKDGNWYVSSVPENVLVSPTAISIATGENVELSCGYDDDISGFDEIFLWQKSINQSLWTDIPNSNDTTYSFISTIEDSGSYIRCKVYRGLKSANSNIVPIDIALGTISITLQPSDTTVYAAESASFYITANSTIGTLSYQWQESSNNGLTWQPAPGSTNSSSYSFTASYSANGYKYRCYLTANGASSLYSNTVTLTVNNNTIIFNTQPSNQTCGQYTSINTFTVSATTTNSQTVSYQWYKADNSPLFNNWSQISAGDTLFSGRNTSQLIVDCVASITHLKCLATYSSISGYSNTAIHTPYSP